MEGQDRVVAHGRGVRAPVPSASAAARFICAASRSLEIRRIMVFHEAIGPMLRPWRGDTMTKLTIQDLFAEKAAIAAQRKAEAAAAAAQHKAELDAFSERVQTYEITDEDRERAVRRIRKAFDNGERELMLIKFPSVLCEDGGRRINNHLEGWQDTLPGVFRKIHRWWEQELKAGGFTFSARIIDFPGGMPGDVGIFIGWPQSLD